MLKRPIPSSGEALPVIGLGTWQTFDIWLGTKKPALTKVLQTMQQGGGLLIDSSPMYGRAEQIVGELTSGMPTADAFFYATKVWTSGKKAGIQQMERSMELMGRNTMDLMQIHNLTDWKTHLPQLREWKESGKIRYTGITHYTDASHEELEKVLRAEAFDFVQFNYSITNRHAEKRLLSVAADLGVATLINRPLGEGRLMQKVKGEALPPWALEHDMPTWSAFFLKYLLADPAVTCVIPATGNPEHAAENVAAGMGALPDQAMRKKMASYIDGL